MSRLCRCFRKPSGHGTISDSRITQDPVVIVRRPSEPSNTDDGSQEQVDGDRRNALDSTPVTADINQELQLFPKSASDEELIRKALRANDFLSSILSEDNIKKIIDALELRIIQTNEVIIKQGDKGKAIYISSKGSYEVIVNGSKKDEFNDMRVFGELALIFNANRLSTIKAASDGAVWCLDRKTYQMIIRQTHETKEEEMFNFLKTVKKLNTSSTDILRLVANLLKNQFFPAGSIIIKEGDPGDLFYIIRAGSVTVSKKDEGVVGKLIKGECFGELALQNKDIRQATVTANAPAVECLTLNRLDFQNYFGDIKITEIQVQKLKSINEVQPQYLDVPLHELVVLGTMGVGGFGRVELVQSKERKELVFALKRISKMTIVRDEKQQHAFNEKYIQLNSVSPFIVQLYRTYKSRKYIYFLMEPCLGGDLFSLLHKNKGRRFKNNDARFIVACVMEALFYLHVRGIIYRDLKPENVLVDNSGYFKLADFGCAKKLEVEGEKTHTFVGTPDYAAPEIIKGNGHDKACDYWGLGILIFELQTGKSPFATGDPGFNKTLEKVLKGMDYVQFPNDFNKNARKLVLKFCKANPCQRLGMSKDGISKVKGDKWFEDFNWIQLEAGSLKSPFKPDLKGPTDLSRFPKYSRRSTSDPPDEMSGWDRDF